MPNDAESPDARAVHSRVKAGFGPSAAAYSVSRGHGDADQLAPVVALAAPRATDRALDIATGAGHTALALAPHVRAVVAFDLTPQMLAEAARNAAARGVTNLVMCEGAAERLPFAAARFQIVTARQAPHHFADVRAAVHEMARVLSPGGRLVIVDSAGLEDDELDHTWQLIEKLRDDSHVRNYRPAEWREMIADAGLRLLSEERGFYTEGGAPLDFATWTARIRTPAARVAQVRALFQDASPRLRAALRIVTNGAAIGFCVPQITLAASKG